MRLGLDQLSVAEDQFSVMDGDMFSPLSGSFVSQLTYRGSPLCIDTAKPQPACTTNFTPSRPRCDGYRAVCLYTRIAMDRIGAVRSCPELSGWNRMPWDKSGWNRVSSESS